MGFLYILLAGAIIFTAIYFLSKPSKKDNVFEGPREVINACDVDPYAQVIWQTLNSGKPTSYQAGDEHMVSLDPETGKEEKIKLKN